MRNIKYNPVLTTKMKIMKQVLVQTESIYYVDSSEMIKFISINAPMVWKDCCDFVKDHNICDDNFGPPYWEKKHIINSPEEYNDEQVKWITAFFETHPWIERMIIVFDD